VPQRLDHGASLLSPELGLLLSLRGDPGPDLFQGRRFPIPPPLRCLANACLGSSANPPLEPRQWSIIGYWHGRVSWNRKIRVAGEDGAVTARKTGEV